MQQLTHYFPAPQHTLALALAIAALTRLGELNVTFGNELTSLPTVHAALTSLLESDRNDSTALEIQTDVLLKQLDDYWQAPSAAGRSRRALFIDGMQQALRDELLVKHHEGDLSNAYASCVPAAQGSEVGQSAPQMFSLHVQLRDNAWCELAGALVFINDQGLALLVLPGVGAQGFASRRALGNALVRWLNHDVLRHALFNTASLRDQQLIETIDSDPQLYLDTFSARDVQLTPIIGKPFAHAVDRLLEKQRADVRHACTEQPPANTPKPSARVAAAIALKGLPGPGAMLEQREMAYWERQQRTRLPDWVKVASPNDLAQYEKRLQQYEQARSVLLSALGGAASHESFARTRLRARLASDLGYALEPAQVIVTSERRLAITGERYTTRHSLLHLALYGLHPGDSSADSAFQSHSVLSLNDLPMQADYPQLTTGYLAKLITELNLGSTFREVQRTAYAAEHHQQLMRELTRQQIMALACTARMQGHIQPGDFAFIEQIESGATTQGQNVAHAQPRVQVQQVRLDDRDVLGGLLVMRKNDAQGRLERLVLFTADAPRARRFQGFDTQTQLIHELVSWSASTEMSHYLLEQVPLSSRDRLAAKLLALRLKPAPSANFVQLITRDHYQQALGQFVRQHVRIAAANQAQRTPDWYLRASAVQRQELLALEEAIAGAELNYREKSHTKAQAFEAYVHQRASKKISELLGVADGSVDPDTIIITSERETLSYTQMLRNGHDDSLGLLSSSADTQATFSGPRHLDLTPLTAQKVGRSVHGKWLCDDYVKQVRQTLLAADSPGYAYRRQTSLLITVLHMQAAALRSHLKGQLDSVHYQWLTRTLEQLHRNDRATRSAYPVHTLQLRMDNPLIATDLAVLGEAATDIYNVVSASKVELTQVETVQGCYLLSPSSQPGSSTLLYTPQAPDGIEYRLLSDFKSSLSSAGMIDYYKDRCRFDARRKLAFFLRDMQRGGASKPPVVPREAIADFHDICFNRPIERQLREVEDSTTGRSDMLAKLLWTTVELLATVVTLPFPPASFAVGALLSLRDSVLALEAFANGDQEAASGYILGSLFNSLGAAGDLSVGMKGFGALRQLDRGGQHGSALVSAKHLSVTPRQADLLPVKLEGEAFWRTRPDAYGYAPLFRPGTDPSMTAQATGQFARRGPNGTWQPLAKPSGQPTSAGTQHRFAVDVSLQDVTPIASGHAQGVSLVNGKYYIELDSRVFEVQFEAQARHWNIIDPHNPFAFFGKRPVRLNDKGTWQTVERPTLLGGAGDEFSPLPSTSTAAEPVTASVAPYELPLASQVHFSVLSYTSGPLDTMGLGIEDYFEAAYRELRAKFARQREKLYHDAQAFFTSATPAPRPALPLLDANADASGLIKKVFENSHGMVLAEAPGSIASKRLLIENMVVLAEQNVKVLYLQHLFTDLHMHKLEKYRKLGVRSKAGSSELKLWLDGLNNGALRNRSKEYDYYHVIKMAHRHGIEVRPLSSSVSYPLVNNPVLSAAGDVAAEQKSANFFSHLLINADVTAHPSRRWVVLVDQKLANTHQQVAGIAELHGAISVRVQDVPANRTTQVSRDVGGSTTTHGAADFKIETGNPLLQESVTSGAASASPNLPPSRLDDALFWQTHDKPRGAINNPYTGKPGFTWDETAGWQTVDAQAWPVAGEPTALQVSLVDNVYGLPSDMRSTLHELVNFESRGLDSRYFLAHDEHAQVRDSFFTLRRKLQKDARSIIARELPSRPAMPAVAPGMAYADFLDDLYRQVDGVVIGEAHHAIASKKLIIDNLPLLAGQDVKTLYLEHLLSDLHQADLDRFVDTGHMSKALLHDLKKLDRGHHTDNAGVYTFEQLVIKARAHGLDIRAIDCTASYHIKDIDNLAPTTRQQMFSHFASRTLRKHQEVMGAHKWIALVGNSHTNTFEKIIPGLAELEGGVGLRVVDAVPGRSRGISIDPGEALLSPLSNQRHFVKSDFLVEMETLKPVNG